MRRAEDGVGMGKAVRAHIIPQMVEKRKPEVLGARDAKVTPLSPKRGARARGQPATTTDPHGIEEGIMPPAKRDANNRPKPDSAVVCKAHERLARDRRQAQHAAEALQQALDDLGLPEDLVAEIEGRLRSQQQLLGKICG